MSFDTGAGSSPPGGSRLYVVGLTANIQHLCLDLPPAALRSVQYLERRETSHRANCKGAELTSDILVENVVFLGDILHQPPAFCIQHEYFPLQNQQRVVGGSWSILEERVSYVAVRCLSYRIEDDCRKQPASVCSGGQECKRLTVSLVVQD